MLPRALSRLPRRSAIALAAALTLLSADACEKVPLLAPTASVITIVTSRSVLPINGTAQIIATVTEQSGTPPQNGTLVTFTTTLGTLEPQEAVTRNGQATVTLRAGSQSGTAMVGAFSGSASVETRVEIQIGGAAAAAVVLNANPGTVPPTGGTVQLAAGVSDASGNLLPGVPVTFTADAGTIASGTVVSDGAGEARTTLTTDRQTIVTVHAGALTATVTIGLSTLPTVTIAATPTTSSVSEPVTFAVNVTAGSSPIREVSVNFGDGTSRSLGALTGATNVTHSYGSAGTYNVVATATDSTGGTVSVATVIVIEGAAPLNVSMTATPGTVQVDVPVTFTATVTQASGTPEILRYEWDFGDGNTAETSGNTTSHVYTGAALRVATVRAVEKDGRTGTGRVEVNVTPRSPLNVNLSANPSPATVDEEVVFTATATGTTVPIASYAWDFGDGTTLTTSGNQVNHVYEADGTKTVKVTVTTVEGVTGSTQISLIVVPPQIEVTLTVSPQSAPVGTPVTFSARVTPLTTVITKYVWTFGDAANTTVTTTSRTTTFPGYALTDVGTRTATVTVTAANGDIAVTSALVTVTN